MTEKNIKRECIYVYNCVTLLYSRNWHNTVNQLYFKKKNQKNSYFSFRALHFTFNPGIYFGIW